MSATGEPAAVPAASAACTVTLRNGVRLQFTGAVAPAMLAELLAAASALT